MEVCVAAGRKSSLSASAGGDIVRQRCTSAMAEVLAGRLRRAGALTTTVRLVWLIVELCRMFGEGWGGVGVNCGWIEGFWGGGTLGGDGARRWWR